MKLAELPHRELVNRLRSRGVALRTGEITWRVRTALDPVARGLALLYADYDLVDPEGFVDFHVELRQPAGPRRWVRPQVLFSFDGEVPFKPLPAAQALPLLEWGLNWCVSNHAHQYLIAHAAVVERNGLAAVFPGVPGAGKSTLCAALVSRGWRLLTDELALFSRDTGRLVPLVRPVSLKNESIEVIGRFAPHAVLGPVTRDTLKGTVAHMRAPSASVQRQLETASPRWIVFPRYRAGAPARLAPLSKGRAFIPLAEATFNYSLLGLEGFHLLGNIVDACDCHEFTYSRLEDAIATFDALSGHG
jgi:hypothetical protein